MAINRVFHSMLLAASVLLVGGCASQPEASLLDKKFERAARHYQKFQHEGQTVYCKKERLSFSNIPEVRCLSEPELRQAVQSFERWRNPVARPVMPGAGQGGIG